MCDQVEKQGLYETYQEERNKWCVIEGLEGAVRELDVDNLGGGARIQEEPNCSDITWSRPDGIKFEYNINKKWGDQIISFNSVLFIGGDTGTYKIRSNP